MQADGCMHSTSINSSMALAFIANCFSSKQQAHKEWENENAGINLKCDPEKAIELRAEFEAINPGFHMSKIHWNTINFNKDVSDKMICELINHSYNLVFKSLTKKMQIEILELQD